MNTQENNKLIAEFMGMQHTDIGWYDNEETLQLQNNTFDELQFYESWDWLMPVVEKIENLGYEFFIVENRVEVSHNTDHSIETIIDLTSRSKRDATYDAVVEFINQYNKYESID
ncbi:MAG: hypothetical protein GY861_06760 [bacterium]|nr:hypothetical protein [bacterium]